MKDLNDQEIESVAGGGFTVYYKIAEFFYDERESIAEGFKQGLHTTKITYGNAGEGNDLPNA